MRRIFLIILALCIVAVMIPVPTSAAVFAKGKCGQSAFWELDEDGTLTIYGNGAIDSSQSVSFPPWKQYTGKITGIIIKSGITHIADNTFAEHSAIKSVTLPETVTSIGDYAFYRCGGLSEIVLPSKLESLGEGAFADSGIQAITIPETVTTVSSGLFNDCDGLSFVTFKGAIKDIGDSAFYSCDQLESVVFEKGFSGEIGYSAFAESEKLREFEISEGVTYIGEMAFHGCYGLTDINLPEGLLYLSNHAFWQTSLVSVTIPKSVTSIGDNVFLSCDQLKNITVYSESMEGLRGTLGGGQALEYIHIIGDAPQSEDAKVLSRNDEFVIYYDEGTSGWVPPTWKDNLIEVWGKEDTSKTGACGESLTWLLKDGVLTISGTGQMYNYACGNTPWHIYQTWFDRVVIEDGVTSIGEHAFCKLGKLASVSIPGSVKEIGAYSFERCQGLKEVTIPEGVETIGKYAFSDCIALASVAMADSVTDLGDSVFYRCENLTDIKLSEGLTRISEHMFSDCRNLKWVKIPDSVTEIGQYGFYGCTSLTSLELPDSVVAIKNCAFASAGLVSITIPASVNSLSPLVFANCESLEYVRFLGDAPTFNANVFSGVTAVCVYPADNKTWDTDVLQNYEGAIIWITDDHTHVYEAFFLESTCTEQGYRGQRCAQCGHTYVEDYVDPLGHDMAEATCAKPSTCRRENCGYQEGSTTDHTWEDPCQTTRTCSVCGHSDNNGGHNWSPAYDDTRYCYTCRAFEGGYLLDLTEIADDAWIDGEKASWSYHEGFRFAIIKNEDAKTLVTYTYNVPPNHESHTRYPTGMKVWRLTLEGDRYKATYVAELENLLQYAGSSIRITGTKGIRMITSIEKSKKTALTGDGLAGYKLVEYGTALCWAKDLEDNKPMVLGQDYVKSNYAYKKGVADPIFAQTDTAVQYTNVLVGFSLDQCKDDIAMRPYIILEDVDGTQITLYGGIVYRSIGYIAYQNRNVFQPGTNSYHYVWEIIRKVYGTKYDPEFKG